MIFAMQRVFAIPEKVGYLQFIFFYNGSVAALAQVFVDYNQQNVDYSQHIVDYSQQYC